MSGTQPEVLSAYKALGDQLASTYGLVPFDQQLLDAAKAGAASRQKEVDDANAKAAQLQADLAAMTTARDNAVLAKAAAEKKFNDFSLGVDKLQGQA